MSRSGEVPMFDQTIMHSATAEVTGREAAQLFGVSYPRWRQISAEVGPGRTEPGVRGSLWRIRDLVTYAAHNGRRLSVPMPPWVPLGLDEWARYGPLQMYGVEQQTVLSERSGGTIKVHAKMFSAASNWRRGIEQPTALILTPLHPAATWQVETPPVLTALIDDALTKIGWLGALALHRFEPNETALAVVVMRTLQDRELGSRGPRVQAFNIPASQLEGAAVEHEKSFMSARSLRQLERVDLRPYHVLASDVAACLGWNVLPEWPYGTATPATVSAWAPGRPVTIPSPLHQTDIRAALAWLIAEASRSTTHKEKNGMDHYPSDIDIRTLAETIAPTLSSEGEFLKASPGFELAARILPPPGAELDYENGDTYSALAWVVNNGDAPEYAGDSLLSYIGDPEYARPTVTPLGVLPSPWPELISDAYDTAKPTVHSGARTRQFEDVLEKTWRPGGIRDLGPLAAPVMLAQDPSGSMQLVWCSSTGFRQETNSGFMPGAALWPDPPFEVVLIQVPRSLRVAGWARWRDGRVAPLPGPPPGYGGAKELIAIRAAVIGISFDDAFGLSFKNLSEPDRLADALVTASTAPVVIAWDLLVALAKVPRSKSRDE